MTLKQKLFKINYFGSVLLNLCLYFFLSSIIYYLFSLNITLVKFVVFFSSFVFVFYLSYKKTELLLQEMKLKNVVIAAKFLLGIITISAALLIHNSCSLSSIYLYLLILAASVIHAVLNRAYNKYYEKINSKNKFNQTKEISFNFNLERILIVILAASTAALIEINIIPLILTATAVYYFISAYINTFQEI